MGIGKHRRDVCTGMAGLCISLADVTKAPRGDTVFLRGIYANHKSLKPGRTASNITNFYRRKAGLRKKYFERAWIKKADCGACSSEDALDRLIDFIIAGDESDCVKDYCESRALLDARRMKDSVTYPPTVYNIYDDVNSALTKISEAGRIAEVTDRILPAMRCGFIEEGYSPGDCDCFTAEIRRLIDTQETVDNRFVVCKLFRSLVAAAVYGPSCSSIYSNPPKVAGSAVNPSAQDVSGPLDGKDSMAITPIYDKAGLLEVGRQQELSAGGMLLVGRSGESGKFNETIAAWLDETTDSRMRGLLKTMLGRIEASSCMKMVIPNRLRDGRPLGRTSRVHGCVISYDGRWLFINLSCTSGTLVAGATGNAERMDTRSVTLLRAGDTVCLGIPSAPDQFENIAVLRVSKFTPFA